MQLSNDFLRFAPYVSFMFSRESSVTESMVTMAFSDERFSSEEAILLKAPEYTVRKMGDGWLYEATALEPACQLKVTADYRTLTAYLPPEGDRALREQKLMLLLRTAVECHFALHNTLSLHAACVEVAGRAVAMTGPSGVGKSTRAKTWADALGGSLISGDRPAIRFTPKGPLACGVPWDGKEQIFRDIELPLTAICEVRRAPFTRARKLSRAQARRLLMSQCFLPMWDPLVAAAAMSLIRRAPDAVPMYRLFCGPDEAAAREASRIVYSGAPIEKEESDMKIREGFVLRDVVDEHIVMPSGENVGKFAGALILNDVGAFIWNALKAPISREDLLSLILGEYDVEEKTAAADLDVILKKFADFGVLEDEANA